jgi:hypothetical protein
MIIIATKQLSQTNYLNTLVAVDLSAIAAGRVEDREAIKVSQFYALLGRAESKQFPEGRRADVDERRCSRADLAFSGRVEARPADRRSGSSKTGSGQGMASY